MRRLSLLASVVLADALTACQEKLTTPVDCPELCPGNSLIVRDTVIAPYIYRTFANTLPFEKSM